MQTLLFFLVIKSLLVLSTSLHDHQASGDVHNLGYKKFPDKPLQLVRPDDTHRRLEVVTENVKLLHNIVGPVATVAVVGKFHSGKSFLMNQLMGKSAGFGIGPSVQPKTMGIWMWGKPIQYELKTGQKVSIIFLDTEGFAANNVSENYDAKIFAVATLLSSHLLYNSVKIIDQADIDYLELLARRTQLFALRSQMSRAKWTNEFNKDLLSFPPLIWVVQDFVQNVDGESPKQWLQRLMTTHSRENELYEISLMDIFKSVDCHTMFLPAVRRALLTDLSLAEEEDLTDEYKRERDDLIRKLKNEIIPKEKNQRPINGLQLAALLEILVNAANDGSLADIPNRWDSFVNRLQTTATEDCIKFYEADMNVLIVEELKNEPVNAVQFEHWHNQSFGRSLELLQQLLHGLDEPLSKGLRDLKSSISIKYDMLKDINEKKIKLKCNQLLSELEIKTEESLSKIKLPMLTSQLIEKAKEIKNLIISEFKTEIRDLISQVSIEQNLEKLRKSIKNQAAAVQLKNNNAIEAFFDLKLKETIEKFLSITSSNFSRSKPRNPTLLTKILEEGVSQALNFFEEKSNKFKDEKVYNLKLAVLKEMMNQKEEDIKKENEEIAAVFIKSESAKLIEKFSEKTSQEHIPLPANNTDLETKLKTHAQNVLNDFEDLFKDYELYSAYQENLKIVRERVGEICDRRRNENVKAFIKEIETPLKMAKNTILLSADRYSTVFSLKQFMRSVCLLHLDEGKPKYWSLKLKSEIIEEFLLSDEQLKGSIESKSGIWSTIVGFFQWILWMLSLS